LPDFHRCKRALAGALKLREANTGAGDVRIMRFRPAAGPADRGLQIGAMM